MPSSLPEIHNRIPELRKERDVTQEEMAAAVGISRQTVISIERGRYQPSLPLTFAIAEYFGHPIEEVFYVADHTPARSNGHGA